MYLPADAVRDTLKWIATNSLPGSSVVFDHTYEATIHFFANIDSFPIPAHMKPAIDRFRQLVADEPWIFGLPAGKEKEFLAGLGLELGRTLGANSREAVENYLTRSDGTIFGGFPASDQQWYALLEAIVPEPRH
jgi:O-methyltransferase involved in polyketide biosynthesis